MAIKKHRLLLHRHYSNLILIKNNVLRIVNIEDTLPKDRESVYWINVKGHSCEKC